MNSSLAIISSTKIVPRWEGVWWGRMVTLLMMLSSGDRPQGCAKPSFIPHEGSSLARGDLNPNPAQTPFAFDHDKVCLPPFPRCRLDATSKRDKNTLKSETSSSRLSQREKQSDAANKNTIPFTVKKNRLLLTLPRL